MFATDGKVGFANFDLAGVLKYVAMKTKSRSSLCSSWGINCPPSKLVSINPRHLQVPLSKCFGKRFFAPLSSKDLENPGSKPNLILQVFELLRPLKQLVDTSEFPNLPTRFSLLLRLLLLNNAGLPLALLCVLQAVMNSMTQPNYVSLPARFSWQGAVKTIAERLARHKKILALGSPRGGAVRRSENGVWRVPEAGAGGQ